jgi:hypothetical protein
MGGDLLTRVLGWLGIRRVARITPQELKQRLDRGENIEILDVRHWGEVLASGEQLPGARWVDRPKAVAEMAPHRAYVLYCN